MKIKNYLKIIFPFIVLSSCILNQPVFNKKNECQGGFKGRYRGELIKNNNNIIELSKIQFAQLIGELKGQMIADTQLDSLHSLELIRIINMIIFSNEEYIKEMKTTYSALNEVETLFYQKYLQKTKCQYPYYDGKNGCLDFRTLGINYGGGYYFHCSIIFVENTSGYDKKTFLKNNTKLNTNNEQLIR